MSYVGMGYDSHRFVKGRSLMVGGVRVPFEKGLAGHSDADVVLHAVIDALLGAAGMGDIGMLYSDKDARWKNADSLVLLGDTFRRLKNRFRVLNVDVTVLAEEPRLGPYKNRMRAKMARVLKISVDRVNVKAKTNEGMGWIGRKEGMAALAVCALEKK